MTETNPVSYMIKPNDPDYRKTTTVGWIMPHLETKIVDEKGEIVEIGKEGELMVKGYSVMKGYYKNP